MVAFEDETWVELLPKLWKCWYLKGKQLGVETPGINKRLNVFITLDFASGRLVYSIHRKRRSKEFKYPSEQSYELCQTQEVQAGHFDHG
jgi:hypothetical protein